MSNLAVSESVLSPQQQHDQKNIPLSSIGKRLKYFSWRFANNSFSSVFLAANWLLLNLLLFVAISSLPVFETVQLKLNSIFGVLFSLLALGVWAFCCWTLLGSVREDLRNGILSVNAAALAFLLFALTVSAAWLYLDFGQFFVDLRCEFLVLACAVVMTYLYIRSILFGPLRDRVNMRFDRSSLPATQIGTASEETNAELAAQKSSTGPGDLLQFAPKSIVSHDCLILEGALKVYEREFSGTGVWCHKQAGDPLYAGSYILAGSAICRVISLPVDARITTLMPAALGFKRSGSGETITVSVCLFLACFSAIFWRDRGLGSELIEPVVGSFICLAFFADWFWIQKIPGLMQGQKLFFKGVLTSSFEALQRLSSIKDVYLRVTDKTDITRPIVDKIEILDDRIDREKLLLVMEALSGLDSQSPTLQAVIEHLQKRKRHSGKVLQLEDVLVYPGGMLCASYQGAELTLGSEAFLLERGVHIPSTVVKNKVNPEDVRYFAIGDQLVATIRFSHATIVSPERLSALQSALAVRLHISAALPQAQLDDIGKELGLDLGYIHAAENEEQFRTRLEGKSASAVIDLSGADTKAYLNDPSLALAVGRFDFLLFDPYKFDVSLLHRNWRLFLEALKDLQTLRVAEATIKYGWPLVFVGLGIAAFLGFTLPETTLLVVGLLVFSSALFLYLSAPDWKEIKSW